MEGINSKMIDEAFNPQIDHSFHPVFRKKKSEPKMKAKESTLY